MKKYEGKAKEEVVDEEDRKTIEIIEKLNKEYGLGENLKNALEIQNWCQENYGGKPIWERNVPNSNSKDEKEKRLGKTLIRIRNRLKKREIKAKEEVVDEEDRKTIEIIEKLDKEYGLGENLKNVLEIQNWCQENYGDKLIWERELPNSNSKDEKEKRLGRTLIGIRYRLKKYEGKAKEEVVEEENRKTIEIIEELDKEYGLGEMLKHALEIQNWCQENYGDKPIWERNLPKSNSKDEKEKKLGKRLNEIRTALKKYEGKAKEEVVDEEDRKTIEIIEELDKEYGLEKSLKNILEIQNWCQEKYGDKPIGERKLPSSESKDKKEKKLGQALRDIRRMLKKTYEGKELEEIEDEEDRKKIEIIRILDEEYNPKKMTTERLKDAKQQRDEAREKNNEAYVLEQQVSEELKKRGQIHEEQ